MTESPRGAPIWRHIALFSLFALMALCVAWEAWIAPIRPGGSWLVLKALPLLLPLKGIWRGNIYTYQWSSMFIMLYVAEGCMRMLSDPSLLSRTMAAGEFALSVLFFVAVLAYVAPAKRAAKARKKAEDAGA